MAGRTITGRAKAAEPLRGWPWGVLAVGLAIATLSAARAQPVVPDVVQPQTAPVVPEVVQPQTGNAVTPPSAGGGPATQPRSENPLVQGPRPVPDNGVIAPPVQGVGPVLRPPATSDMPVIPPPGSPGGNRAVVPK